jgi:outer membrane protein, heavy metal efflux system
MHLSCRYILPLLLASALPARAQLTLSNAVATALAGNPELKAAREQIAVATGRAIQSRAWENPELELSAEDVPIDDGGLSNAKNMLGLSQTVPFPGKKSLDAKIGQRGISAAESDYITRERELVRLVKAEFFRVIAAEQKVTVTEQLLDLSESLVNAATKRVESGATGSQESLRADIERERARVELTAVRRELQAAQIAVATLLGQPHQPLPAVQGELRADVPVVLADAGALAHHPVLLAARAKREQAELQLRRAKLDPLPDVKLGVAGGVDGAVDETLMEFRVSFPLPLIDRSQGRKREARALVDIAHFDLTATEQRLLQDFAVASARLRAAGEQVETYRTRILPKAEEALKLVRGGFDAGKFGFLDRVDTQRTLAEARLAYLDKLLELNLALSELESLAGTTTKE